MQLEFPEDGIIGQLLPLFYRKYDLDEDGGFNNPTVRIVVYKNICIYIPNIDARRKAVLKHDIHHMVTGYKSDFKGETEIGAWEIASGCSKYWVAFVLDLSGMILGLLFNFAGVFRAFIRGKRTKNLYNDTISDKQVLVMTIDELREKLGLDINFKQKITLKEMLSFIVWCIGGGIYSVLSILLLPVLVVYSIIIAAGKKSAKTSIVNR